MSKKGRAYFAQYYNNITEILHLRNIIEILVYLAYNKSRVLSLAKE